MAYFSGDGSDAAGATLSGPNSVVVDSSDNIYIADTNNNCIRKLTVHGNSYVITTVAGVGTKTGSAGDGSSASAALLNGPLAVAVDASSNLYIADTGNNRIRKVTGLTGVISTIAGKSINGGSSGDGSAAVMANMNVPSGVAVDSVGNIYIADTSNSKIRRISATGVIKSGVIKSLPILIPLSQPAGLAIAVAGNSTFLYIADAGIQQVLKIGLGEQGSVNSAVVFAGCDSILRNHC